MNKPYPFPSSYLISFLLNLTHVTLSGSPRPPKNASFRRIQRTWLKIIWAAAEGLVLETFPVEATRGRSASHLQACCLKQKRHRREEYGADTLPHN